MPLAQAADLFRAFFRRRHRHSVARVVRGFRFVRRLFRVRVRVAVPMSVAGRVAVRMAVSVAMSVPGFVPVPVAVPGPHGFLQRVPVPRAV